MMRPLQPMLLVALAFLFSAPCFAHKQSASYLALWMDGSKLQGHWDIALRDLDFAIGLDADSNGRITWGETRRRTDTIWNYALPRLRIHPGSTDESPCALHPGELLIDDHVDGAYAVLRFDGDCATAASQIVVAYSLLEDLDPNHRGLLELRTGHSARSRVLPNDGSPASLPLDTAGSLQQFGSFVHEGVRHLWLGYDHILFLLTLLLPAVLLRAQGEWRATVRLRDGLVEIVKVVSAFTLAHSATLSLAALGLLQLPTRLVESAIAFTVLLAALNLLYPVVHERRWLIALGFGLIHGLGFAAVLGDLGLSGVDLAGALVGFNIGVELGQLTIVLLLMPLIFLVRDTPFYRRALLPASAVAMACLAGYWMITRAFPGIGSRWT